MSWLEKAKQKDRRAFLSPNADENEKFCRNRKMEKMASRAKRNGGEGSRYAAAGKREA